MNKSGVRPLLHVSATCCHPLVVTLRSLTCRTLASEEVRVASMTFVAEPHEPDPLVASVSVELLLSSAAKIPRVELVAVALTQSETENCLRPLRNPEVTASRTSVLTPLKRSAPPNMPLVIQ